MTSSPFAADNLPVNQKKLVIIQNDPEVPAGCYGHYLRKWKIPFAAVAPYAGHSLPSLQEVGALLVLGGAMGVGDTQRYPFLLQVKRMMSQAVEQETPILGICLGGQLLAEVAGATVHSNRFGEKGTLPVALTEGGVRDPLMAGITSPFMSFQWHNDSFDLPAGATLLAFSDVCPHQAFRCGTNAYGLQFHPEVNAGIVENWAHGSDDTLMYADRFVAAFVEADADYDAASRLLFMNFLTIAGFTPIDVE